MKPFYKMSSSEIDKLMHEQKRKTTPLPELDTIRKGFEVCWSGGLPQRCVECPYHHDGCNRELEMDALDIINAQAAYIEQLEEALNRGKS